MTDTKAVIAEIISAQRELQRSFAEDRSNPLFDSPLTMSQLKLMLMLHHSGGSGGQELARSMGVSLATLTGIVDRMVIQGLVTRREDPTDRRVRRIELTAHGSRTIDGIVTSGTQKLHQLLSRIDRPGLDVIHQALLLMCQAVREPAAPAAGKAPVKAPSAKPADTPAETPPGAAEPATATAGRAKAVRRR